LVFKFIDLVIGRKNSIKSITDFHWFCKKYGGSPFFGDNKTAARQMPVFAKNYSFVTLRQI